MGIKVGIEYVLRAIGFGAIGDDITPVSAANPLPVTLPAAAASGATAVTGDFTATGQSASFTPVSGRDFNVSTRGTFVGSLQLERSFDAGSNWHPLTALGTQIGIWTTPFSEIYPEPQFGVLYRLNCTAYTSGTATYRISQ